MTGPDGLLKLFTKTVLETALNEASSSMPDPENCPTCLIHLIRNSFRLTSRKHSDTLKRNLKAMYEARRIRMTPKRLDEKFPRMICSINTIESLNTRYRCGAGTGVFPDRTDRHEVPVSYHSKPRPDRDRGGTVDDALETCGKLIRHG